MSDQVMYWRHENDKAHAQWFGLQVNDIWIPHLGTSSNWPNYHSHIRKINLSLITLI